MELNKNQTPDTIQKSISLSTTADTGAQANIIGVHHIEKLGLEVSCQYKTQTHFTQENTQTHFKQENT